MLGGFHHSALLYSSRDEFLAGTAPFVRAGVDAREPTLVILRADKLGTLRDALGARADEVAFADMDEVGLNPARLIPAWREFVDANAGRRVRGLGEPIYSERSPEALVECQHHEALLNLALQDAAATLLCPYDGAVLDAGVLHEARCSHPQIVDAGEERASDCYGGEARIAAAITGPPLRPPAGRTHELAFDDEALAVLRRFVAVLARDAELSPARTSDLVLAVNEVATNSIRHGGGKGLLRIWIDDGGIVCEVRDDGRIEQPLAGRVRPSPDQLGGYGLWLVNQLCDLVQIRSHGHGSVVRMHMHRDA